MFSIHDFTHNLYRFSEYTTCSNVIINIFCKKGIDQETKIHVHGDRQVYISVDPWYKLVLDNLAIPIPIFSILLGTALEITSTAMNKDGNEKY